MVSPRRHRPALLQRRTNNARNNDVRPWRRTGRRAARTRPSRVRPTRSSACRRRASADRICGPIAVRTRSTGRSRWATSTSASSKRSARTSPRSAPTSSWWARSSHLTTPARSAKPVTRRRVSTARSSAPQVARKPSGCGSRWPTAPWSPPRRFPPPISCRISWRPQTCWERVGLEPLPPKPDLARQ